MPAAEERWGFCDRCERWRCSEHWLRDGADRPACPECGAPPAILETLQDGRASLRIVLELPPGRELPLLS